MGFDNIIAIIPARGGSKGVPRKNIRLLRGKPLIVYSIEAAIASQYLTRVIVSTEDTEIAECAKKYGAEVVERPESLARDDSSPIDVIIQVLDFIKKDKGQEPELVVLLQPTSPFRTSEDIDKAIEKFHSSQCESVVSICACQKTPYKTLIIENEKLIPFIDAKHLHASRQSLPTVYYPNGAIYIAPPSILREKKTFHVKKSVPYFMPPERSFDIDTELDLSIAECIMNINPEK